MQSQVIGMDATIVSSATSGCCRSAAALLCLYLAAACSAPPVAPPGSARVIRGAEPSQHERYCAWYGDASLGVLYFGQSAFWSTFRRAGGDPSADLQTAGPQWIGRFDLHKLELLPALDVSAAGARSGVWDVLAHANGHVYYTTYFESMGRVEVATGKVERFDHLGPGLNEIAAGPDGGLLISRYAAEDGQSGSVVVISPDGVLLAEHLLPSRPGERVLPKTVAFDPVRREIWVTTDRLFDDGRPDRHDALVLGVDGRLKRRITDPEVHFVVFDDAGTGYRALVDGTRLRLAIAPAEGPERQLVLDENFAPDLDFVQDIQIDPNGRAIVTRWSGFVHLVDPSSGGDLLRTLRLPALESGGLYYTAVPSQSDPQICATYCAGVTVVCR